eukprot:TRINITY_DN7476_c0_g1_i2.p1 TRINITY_DN7476_c0_g1~~TRINITY_DN7476_c0_g1_i2.p1  ORF type:complete len:396 (+),score=63.20 TRINITY_DN7476_c0_g1_i2:63-1250(+)
MAYPRDVNSGLSDEIIMKRYKCDSYTKLHHKMSTFNYQFNKQAWPYSVREMRSRGLSDPVISYDMELLQATADCNTNLQNVVNGLSMLKEAPTTMEEPDPTPIENLYDAFIQDNYISRGVDAPGSLFAPYGLGYFDEFYMSMFLGNYTDFMEITSSMTKEQLDKALRTRVGYLKHTPIFIPIVGQRMYGLPMMFDWDTVKKVQAMFPKREKQHLKIFKKLIQLGAEVNVRELTGKTPLFYTFYVMHPDSAVMASIMLKMGLSPNERDFSGSCPLGKAVSHGNLRMVEILMEYNADPYTKITNFDPSLIIEFAARSLNIDTLRLLLQAPRKEDTRSEGMCARCRAPSVKMCSNCKLIRYCSLSCQKENWPKHRPLCKIATLPKKPVHSLAVTYARL